MSNLLEAKNLYKNYADKKILKNINLEIKKGDFLAIMGKSGSGKSTLLYCLSGLEKFNSGTILFDKQNISTLTEQQISKIRLNKIGFIFQNFHLLHKLSVKDNILLPAFKERNISKKNKNKLADELLKKMNIYELSNSDIKKISGGQLQRVAICRALINNPDIIFADEPTGALDSKSGNQVMDILTELNNSGKTIVLVTHDIHVAKRANKIILIADGEIKDSLSFNSSDKDLSIKLKILKNRFK